MPTRLQLINEAQSLKSEHGENPEYDRALCELIYWTCGSKAKFDGLESVYHEVGVPWPGAIIP